MSGMANFFEDFEDALFSFFGLEVETQNEVIKLCNKMGPHVSVYDFAEIIDAETTAEAEHILQTLAIMIYEGEDDHKRFIDMLNDSDLHKSLKARIVNFTTKLNKVGKDGFKIRYFIDASNIDEPSMLPITHNVFLKAIQNYDEKVVCHVPLVRLEFTFDKSGGKEQVILSIDQLRMIIDELGHIYTKSIEAMDTYRDVTRVFPTCNVLK